MQDLLAAIALLEPPPSALGKVTGLLSSTGSFNRPEKNYSQQSSKRMDQKLGSSWPGTSQQGASTSVEGRRSHEHVRTPPSDLPAERLHTVGFVDGPGSGSNSSSSGTRSSSEGGRLPDVKQVHIRGGKAAEESSADDAGFSEELVKRISSVAAVAQLCPDVEPDEFLEDLADFELPGAVQASGPSISKKATGNSAGTLGVGDKTGALTGVKAAATSSSNISSSSQLNSGVNSQRAPAAQVMGAEQAKAPTASSSISSSPNSPDKWQITATKAAPGGILSLGLPGTPYTFKASHNNAVGGVPPMDPIKAAVAGAKAAGGKGWDGVPLNDMPQLLKVLAQPPSPPPLANSRGPVPGPSAAGAARALGAGGELDDQLTGMLVGVPAPGGLRRPQTNARFKRVLQQNTAAMAFLEGASKKPAES